MRPQLDTTKYAVIYPRQSSQDQVENNIYSLERQMQLKGQAERDGFPAENVIVVDDDLGLSGRSIEKRPGFSRALKLIEQGVVAAIYVEDLTRLSRDERTIDQMVIADACDRGGTFIYMGRSWYDMRDAGQRQSYKYQAVGASEYWKAHMTKLHENHRWKAMQGKAACQVPVGYRAKKDVPKNHPDRDRLIVYEDEAAVIRAIVAQLPAAGSVRSLFRQINPTYWPNGSQVTFSNINRFLKSHIYRGTLVWGSVRVENAHEPIILPDQAAMIDQLLELNRATRRKGSTEDRGVLSGLVWCAECRIKMYNGTSASKSTYRCELVGTDRVRTNHFTVRGEVVDRLILEDLWTHLQTGMLDAIIGQLKSKKAHHMSTANLGENNRKTLQRRVDGLARSLSDPDITETARKVLLLQLDQAAKDLEAVEREQKFSPNVDQDLAFYENLKKDAALLASLPMSWGDEPIQWRRSWMRRFVERVDITRRKKGSCLIKVTYLDGSEASLEYKSKAEVHDEELIAFQELWGHPDRPVYGWWKWIAAGLAERGYQADRRRVYLLSNRSKAHI